MGGGKAFDVRTQDRKPSDSRRNAYRGTACGKFNGDLDGFWRGNGGVNRANASETASHSKVSSFGIERPLPVRSCNTNRTSEVTRSCEVSTLSVRIPRAYFWKRLHSAFVGTPSNDFTDGTVRREDSTCLRDRLTNRPVATIQKSARKHLSNGSNQSWDSHNASNTGASKLL